MASQNEVWKFQQIVYDCLAAYPQPGISTENEQLAPSDVVFLNHGQDKYVYTIPGNKIKGLLSKNTDNIIATAVPIVHEYNLEKEFELLEQMEKMFGTRYTPAPQFYHRTKTAKVLGMDFIKAPVIGEYLKDIGSNGREALAENLGTSVGEIYRNSGLFHVEPHNENILVSTNDGTPEVKFIDAIHFEKGSIDELFEVYLHSYSHERDELVEHPETFKNAFFSALRR